MCVGWGVGEGGLICKSSCNKQKNYLVIQGRSSPPPPPPPPPPPRPLLALLSRHGGCGCGGGGVAKMVGILTCRLGKVSSLLRVLYRCGV